MVSPVSPRAQKLLPPGRNHNLLMLALVAVLAFTFVSALAVLGVAAFRCVDGGSCAQLEALSREIMAWAGAIITAVTGILILLGRKYTR